MPSMQYKLHNHPTDLPSHRKQQILITDEHRALSAKVMHYILDALEVNVKLVSPHIHGSLKLKGILTTSSQDNYLVKEENYNYL